MIISKLEAARIQLDAAIEHFFYDEHVCSLTLAGAAEDILAGLLQSNDEQSPFEFLHDWYQREYNVTYSKTDFSRQIANLPRNWLKHAKEDTETQLEISKQDSILMLMRAVPCYYKLANRHSEKMKKFNQYVNLNIKELNNLFS
jgi:hypothetical protein